MKPLGNLRRTAYLNGVRGFAAILVYWHHHQLWAHGSSSAILENGFGFQKRYHFATFPGIRTLFTGGPFAVATFFVISGYVLSSKPLSLIHAGELKMFGDCVASALFRRWLRLYIPIICITILYMTCWHVFGLWIYGVEPQRNWYDEIQTWFAEFRNFSFVFDQVDKPWFSYNVHLWSIPVEFKGSVVVYTSLLALSRCSRNARLWCQVVLILYFLYVADGWYCAMFTAGMFLQHLDVLADMQ